MNKKRIVFAVCLLVFTAAAIVYTRSQGSSASPNKQQAHSKQSVKPQDIYELMFRHHAGLQKRAEAAERGGQDGREIRTFYKRQAKLTDRQAEELDAVAVECVSELESLDAKAKQLVAEGRARVPEGKLEPGQAPPPPPKELYTLQDAREAKVLRAMAKLRARFGDAEFARFDEFVHRTIAANMKSSSPGERNLKVRPLQHRAQPRHP